jgi:hypothetical protein
MPSSETAALAEALSLGKRDLAAARAGVRILRQRALRRRDSVQAAACLVALRLFASVGGDEGEEARVAAKLAAERGEWMDLFWLGRIHERRGHFSKARTLYRQALGKCKRRDPDRDLVVSALAALPDSR